MDGPGFEIKDHIFTDSECRVLAEVFSAPGMRRGRAGARHLMSSPIVSALAVDTRLLEIARMWVGGGAVPYRATLFSKTGEHNWLVTWHQDTALPLEARLDSPEWGPWSAKEGILYAHAPTWALSQIVALRLHLDSSSERNGPLRVVPESHRRGVLTDEEVFKTAKEVPAVECLAGQGAILAMSPLLIHASSKAELSEPRRVLHIEYAATRNLSPQVTLALA
jgi:ectoine hydroxylase-related dioxygenase (phytanoyl-CoA dioxygenase family)